MTRIFFLFIALTLSSCFVEKNKIKHYYFVIAEVDKAVYFSRQLTYTSKPNLNKSERKFRKFLKQHHQVNNPKINFVINKIGYQSPIITVLEYRKAKFLTTASYKRKDWSIVETDFRLDKPEVY